MFVQVVKGRTSQADAVRAHGEKWQSDVRPVARGYLGSTTGVANDGTLVAVVQFTDETAAKENSDLREQNAWYEELVGLLDGEPTFLNSTDTGYLFDGPSPAATFVQIMESTVADRPQAEAIETPELLEQLRAARPDLLGGLRVWLDGGKVLEVAYFTSEAEARKGEQSEQFGDQAEAFGNVFKDMTYIDLPNPQIDLV